MRDDGEKLFLIIFGTMLIAFPILTTLFYFVDDRFDAIVGECKVEGVYDDKNEEKNERYYECMQIYNRNKNLRRKK